MKQVKNSAIELIGRTPLVELCNYERKQKLNAHLIAKVEYFNPSGNTGIASIAAMKGYQAILTMPETMSVE